MTAGNDGDIARALVIELFHVRGAAVADDWKNFDALLRDTFAGSFRRERATLVNAAEDGVPGRLRRSSAGPIGRQLLVSQIANRLHTDAGLDLDAATWAVDTFATALFGPSPKSAEPTPVPPPPTLVPPTPTPPPVWEEHTSPAPIPRPVPIPPPIRHDSHDTLTAKKAGGVAPVVAIIGAVVVLGGGYAVVKGVSTTPAPTPVPTVEPTPQPTSPPQPSRTPRTVTVYVTPTPRPTEPPTAVPTVVSAGHARTIALIDMLESKAFNAADNDLAGYPSDVYGKSDWFRKSVDPLLKWLKSKSAGEANPWIANLGGDNRHNEVLQAGSKRYVVFESCRPNDCTHGRLYGFAETTTGQAGAVLYYRPADSPVPDGKTVKAAAYDWSVYTGTDAQAMLDVLRVRVGHTSFPVDGKTRAAMVRLLGKLQG